MHTSGSPFDQVVVSAPAKLHYSELMRVMEVCSRQSIAGNPKGKLKLSLVDEESPAGVRNGIP